MHHERNEQLTSITLETIAAAAVEVTLRDGFHAPTLIVEASRNTIVATFDSLDVNRISRTEQFYQAGLWLAPTGDIGILKQVFFTFEGWMSTVDPASTTFVTPSADPNRKEVLVVVMMNAQTDEARGVLYEMIRDKDQILREIRPSAQFDKEPIQAQSSLLAAFRRGFADGGAS